MGREVLMSAEYEELCYWLKNRRCFIKDSSRITCQARVLRERLAEVKSHPSSLMGEQNPGSGRHQGSQMSDRDDSGIKSGRLDTD